VNAQINPYVVDPQWHGLIIWYFFLGGIAAGSYVMAVLADLLGDEAVRRSLRTAYYLAFPLVGLCGILLVIDLGRPERFFHMLVQSSTGRPMIKWWSPISLGSWGLAAFGFFSALSFLGVLAEDGWPGLRRFAPVASRLRTHPIGRLVALGGVLSAFFLGSYTGVLLSATNQPLWANTTWTGALFLASSVSTGLAAIIVIDRAWDLAPSETAVVRLERLDDWVLVLELLLLSALVLSLGRLALVAFRQWPGILLPSFVVPAGLLAPLGLKRVHGTAPSVIACLLVLFGGFALRAVIVGSPASLILSAQR
jgi:formate-dependent nitrite reductase membrane component NrfD